MFLIPYFGFADEGSSQRDEDSTKIEEIEKSEEEILNDTIAIDIDTSSYDELVFWCRRLGLDYSGSKSSLQDRLKKLYGVTSSTASYESSPSGKDILIESAQKTSYYKIEEIQEDYIRIVGNVAVVLEERNDSISTTHRVTADYIIFNKKQKFMSAYGHVVYERRSASSSEFFKGDSLVFNIDSWEGVIYKGVSQKDKSGGDSSNTFYYSGEKLIKGKDDKIKMINGKISSSDGDFPIYSISASNIWVLAPGEWAIKNATIRVGEVPLVWVPFFLMWGDHFIFNPAVGKSDDIGSYLNTTYYLIGQKSSENSADSFNFLDPSNGESNTKFKEGLFLRSQERPKKERRPSRRKAKAQALALEEIKNNPAIESSEAEAITEVDATHRDESKEDQETSFPADETGTDNMEAQPSSDTLPSEDNQESLKDKKASRPKKEKKEIDKSKWEAILNNESSYLKIMADAYSNIGQYFGIQGSLAGIENVSTLEFHLGIGLSYYGANSGSSISSGMDVQKKSRMVDPTLGLLESNIIDYYGMVLDHSYFFGFLVPFRYGAKAKFAYNNSKYYWNTRMEMAIYSDSQYEDHFLKYRQENFNFEQALGLTEDEPIYNSANRISKLNWYMENSFSGLNKLLPSSFNSYISNISLSKLNINFDFIQDSFYDTLLNYRGNSTSLATVKKEYFVPSQLILPDISFNLRGSFFNTTYSSNSTRSSISSKQKSSQSSSYASLIKSPMSLDKPSSTEGKTGSEGESDLADGEQSSSDKDKLSDVDSHTQPHVDDLLSDVQVKNFPSYTVFSHQLDYSIRTFSLQLLGKFIHQEPTTPTTFHQLGATIGNDAKRNSIINFQLSSMMLKLQGDLDLSYNASIFDSAVTIADTLSFTSAYQNTFYVNEVLDTDKEGGTKNDIQDRNELVRNQSDLFAARVVDYQNSSLRLTNTFSVNVNPFKNIEAIKGSSISYNLNNTILYYRYDSTSKAFKFDLGKWDANNVSSHQLRTNLRFTLFEKEQALSLSFILPPKEVTITPTIDTKIGMFSNSLSFSIYKAYENEAQFEGSLSQAAYSLAINNLRNISASQKLGKSSSNWYIKDINNNSSLSFGNGISINNSLQYGVLEERLKNMTTGFVANLYNGNINFSQNLRISQENQIIIPDLVNMSLKLWFFSLSFSAQKDQPLKFDWSQFSWVSDTTFQKQITPKTLDLSFSYRYDSPAFWKNRITMGFDVASSLQYNFMRFTDSKLDFSLSLNMKIYKLFDISLSMKSTNSALFLYSKNLVSKLNEGADPSNQIVALSFFEDLFRSFGSTAQRKESNFNLSTISFKMTHHLGEWDLVFDYSGAPTTFNASTGTNSNTSSWKRNFSISVTWKAIDLIKTNINVDRENKLTL